MGIPPYIVVGTSDFLVTAFQTRMIVVKKVGMKTLGYTNMAVTFQSSSPGF